MIGNPKRTTAMMRNIFSLIYYVNIQKNMTDLMQMKKNSMSNQR